MSVNLRSLDLNLLPVFDALVCEQHLSRAAERLAMSQPAVSNALKRLRVMFNDELFIRTARGLTPTPRAFQLHDSLQPALAAIKDSCVNQTFDATTNDQCVQVAMNAASEYLIAPALITALRKDAPYMQLKIYPDHLEDMLRQLKQGTLDFALDYVEHDPLEFRSQALVEEGLAVICSRDHGVIQGKVSLKQFETLPQVTIIPRSTLAEGKTKRKGTPIEQLMGEDVPQRNLAMFVSSFVVVPDVVANSDLIAVVPKRLVEHYHSIDKLQVLPLPFAYPNANIRLVWHKNRDNDVAHQWFRQWLANTLD
ncbi:hypothetical protein A9Q99_17160 [Gammaproteobacteria bacterium 45_16_T64]|nr:hypothetical protein A9Q99_17160 [Gammaproteobacteria bacterium 45_16_T64]